uniref:Uncharacterized protein n=1 Tax=Aegilops tauschii subsp. strangulata TaxID=200361 RepID=A0A453S988_AEGTS
MMETKALFKFVALLYLPAFIIHSSYPIVSLSSYTYHCKPVGSKYFHVNFISL